MRQIRDAQPGGVLASDTLVYGQLIGDSTVPHGVLLVLRGQIVGSLTVETGGRAEIAGQVTGDLINGGEVTIMGMVGGRFVDAGGTANIAPDAVIGG
jgi:hypothetical protein